MRTRAGTRNGASRSGWRASLEQTSLINRLGKALRHRRLGLVRRRFRRTRDGRRCLRPIGIRGGADAAVGEFDRQMRTWSDRGGGVHSVPLRIAYQGKAAGEHAAVGQRRQQLAAMGDARVKALQSGQWRASGTGLQFCSTSFRQTNAPTTSATPDMLRIKWKML